MTTFYLYIALGGFIGGAFINFAAPFLFDSFVETPYLLALALVLSESTGRSSGELKIIVGILLCLLITFLGLRYYQNNAAPSLVKTLWALPLLLSYAKGPGNRTLGTRLLLVISMGTVIRSAISQDLYEARNFFGTLRVVEARSPAGPPIHHLMHGITVHGSQRADTPDSCTPTNYYHPTGPAGSVLRSAGQLRHLGIVGLGAGALACYISPDQDLDFFEINPLIHEIAHNQFLFTFLKNARARQINHHIGDARITLRGIDNGYFDLLVIDAFSSDAIPVHLITVEAMGEFVAKLKPNGALLIHISNKYLDLRPTIAGTAAGLALKGFLWSDFSVNKREAAENKSPSEWVLLGKDQTTLKQLMLESPWVPLGSYPTEPWTDERSSVISALHF